MAQLVVPTGTFSRMRDVDVNRLLASRSLESTESSPKNPNILGEIVRIVRIRSHGSVGRAHRSHRWGHRFESCCDHHSKYQLLIQRLVLFFYPMVAQIPLQQGLSRTFLEKVFWSSFIFHYTNRRGEQFCLPRLCLLPHLGQNDAFLRFVKLFELETFAFIILWMPALVLPWKHWLFHRLYGIVLVF